MDVGGESEPNPSMKYINGKLEITLNQTTYACDAMINHRGTRG